jgi:arylsulfatase A
MGAPSRRLFLAGSTALGGALLGGNPVQAQVRPSRARADSRPNILLVLADDLGYGEIGAYGQRLIKTPVVDRLAREGLRFTQAYASAPVCAPSRCSLLTGLNTGRSKVRNNPREGTPRALGEQDATFAELLRSTGYRTGLFGKWGFGPERASQASHPHERGFDEFFGYLTHGAAHDYYPDRLWHNEARAKLPRNAGGRHGTYAPDLFRDRAVDFLKESSDAPFLLFFSPNLPHAPSTVPSLGHYRGRHWSKADRGHAAQVTRLDSHIGSLLEALPADRPTLVLVTADNGPHEEGGVDPDRFNANGPFRGYKRNLYEGGIRVPLIAWAPGLVRRGVSRRITQQTDLFPTFTDLAGAQSPSSIDGLSLRSTLTGRPARPEATHLYWYRDEIHSTRRANAAEHGSVTRVAEAVRQDDWKLLRFAPGRHRPTRPSAWKHELYNLARDPGESRNLAKSHPKIVARLSGLADRSWRTRNQV